ncbi:hypothetical protein K450DRAFT_255167 [Umbelopsis ramanniana AG]|uniref:Uncharacterized protein n=1 Tax=Umbelopsis ramanniana AG TaxID=1314678 RepID=A0AAD5E3F5_UMBRA|nr:uncharacterized protein K450DRAFT_255167 [Umbelopsis ramanniana AG]KAI8576823.1 hypothetical protein K450DRAFT_255167 [Umbelopsis ramanniana AG]
MWTKSRIPMDASVLNELQHYQSPDDRSMRVDVTTPPSQDTFQSHTPTSFTG